MVDSESDELVDGEDVELSVLLGLPDNLPDNADDELGSPVWLALGICVSEALGVGVGLRVPARLALRIKVGVSVLLGVPLCESDALCDTDGVWALGVDENVAVVVAVSEAVYVLLCQKGEEEYVRRTQSTTTQHTWHRRFPAYALYAPDSAILWTPASV